MRTSLVVAALLTAGVGFPAQQESYEYQEGAIVQQAVDDVMSRPEFQRLRIANPDDGGNPAWLERFLDWLEQWLAGSDAGDGRTAAVSATYFLYGAALLIVLAALAFIIKSVIDVAHERELAEEEVRARLVAAGAAPGETPPEEFWQRAHDLAWAGDEKRAIRELLLGGMSTLERRGLIRHRRGLTNRDYFWAATGAMRSSMSTIITVFERVYFGRRRATVEMFRECADAYREGFPVTSPETETP